jgi:hypothetical protein
MLRILDVEQALIISAIESYQLKNCSDQHRPTVRLNLVWLATMRTEDFNRLRMVRLISDNQFCPTITKTTIDIAIAFALIM